MTPYTKNFIASLQLPELSSILLRTKQCCDLFFTDYYGKNFYIIDDLLNYREFKLKSEKISLDDFIKMCYNKGIKEAFENSFFQLISSKDAEFINSLLLKKKISLKELYDVFENDINKNIIQHITLTY